MYLDDLISGQVDPQTAAIYLSPSHLHTTQDPALTRLEAQVHTVHSSRNPLQNLPNFPLDRFLAQSFRRDSSSFIGFTAYRG